MKSKVISPSSIVCNECHILLSQFDLYTSKAHKIQIKLVDKHKKQLVGIENADCKTILKDLTANLPVEEMIELLSDEEYASDYDEVKEEVKCEIMSKKLPTVEVVDPLCAEIDSKTESSKNNDKEAVSNDCDEKRNGDNMIPTEVSHQNEIPSHSLICEEKMMETEDLVDSSLENEMTIEEKEVDSEAQHEIIAIAALKISKLPSTISSSSKPSPKIVIGLSSSRTFSIVNCITCSRSYISPRAFAIHKKLHGITSTHVQCDHCPSLVPVDHYVTHTMKCFGVEADFLKCQVENCENELSTVEELAKHLKNHKRDPNFLASSSKPLPKIQSAQAKSRETLKKKKTCKVTNPKKKQNNTSPNNFPCRRRYPCVKCGKGFALVEFLTFMHASIISL